jgi:prephenate dehydrogenase
MTSVLVLGTGLIGTSLGLALIDAHDGSGRPYEVLMHDVEPEHLHVALSRGAGQRWDGHRPVDVVVAAGPPAVTASQLSEAQRLGLGATYTHVASVQSQVQQEVEGLNCDLSAIVGGHPLAGRETSGPAAARADLFLGRPWALCPSDASSREALSAVWSLAEATGAVPVRLTAQEHDRAVAVLSHLPQVVSSALAGLLVAEPTEGSPLRTELSGPGLADTTRLAASSPRLWTEILSANGAYVAPSVRTLAHDLLALADALEDLTGTPLPAVSTDDKGRAQAARKAVEAFLVRGNQGRSLVAVKRGVRDVGFAQVAVTVDDRPGRLAALLSAAGAASVNVEDVHVDHLPGRPTGVIELLVDVDAATGLERALIAGGWQVRSRTDPT